MFRRTHFIAMLAACLSVGGSTWAEEAVTKEFPTKPATKPATKQPATKQPMAEPAAKEPDADRLTEELKKKATDKVVAGSRKKEPLYDLARLSPRAGSQSREPTASRHVAGCSRATIGERTPPRRYLVDDEMAERADEAFVDGHSTTHRRRQRCR